MDWARWALNRRNKVDNAQQVDEFVRAYSYAVMDRRISEYNFMNHLTWDVSDFSPAGPDLLELAFALPEFEMFPRLIKQRRANAMTAPEL